MKTRRRGVIVGVSDHAGWAVLVTVAEDGSLVDRRRVNLVDAHLPALPHHHEAQGLPLEQAVELIGRVRDSANRHANLVLGALATDVGVPIEEIAMRRCPPLPPAIAERIQDYRAQTVADTVMYREALAGAAASRGWPVHWYDAKTVLAAASAAMRGKSLDAHFARTRKTAGSPWNDDHRLAMAAAIVARHTRDQATSR